ncbi:MAG TPA: trypsin-like peptidase domain-containing protein [Anaeromyxobacteraceae bacterium]|nr:trypsin-like peptidase domain-containing protein [Anaeromyxobacteraceae bacterium]
MRAAAAILGLGVLVALPGDATAAGRALYSEAHAATPATLPQLAPLARAVLPAVVGVLTAEKQAAAPAESEDPLKQLHRHFHRDTPRQAIATGFIIHRDGWILTNAHVVEDAGRVEVDLGDEGGKIDARIAGVDTATDVALLKVDGRSDLPVVPLGDSDRLEIADWIMVIGNPFGLSHSVTLGIVSQVGRSDISPAGREGYYDFIQTDASINPGNSGGPIVNLRGEVVGIATAINATGQGIGFAIPINMAKDVLDQLRDTGRVVRSYMGVSVRELPRKGRATPRGVVVTRVASGSPAAHAGITEGDVITGFEGRDIPTAARLRWLVASAGVGRRVALTLRRADGEKSVQVRLGDMPDPAAERQAAARRLSTDDEPASSE